MRGLVVKENISNSSKKVSVRNGKWLFGHWKVMWGNFRHGVSLKVVFFFKDLFFITLNYVYVSLWGFVYPNVMPMEGRGDGSACSLSYIWLWATWCGFREQTQVLCIKSCKRSVLNEGSRNEVQSMSGRASLSLGEWGCLNCWNRGIEEKVSVWAGLGNSVVENNSHLLENEWPCHRHRHQDGECGEWEGCGQMKKVLKYLLYSGREQFPQKCSGVAGRHPGWELSLCGE